jgi:hypothetical protein
VHYNGIHIVFKYNNSNFAYVTVLDVHLLWILMHRCNVNHIIQSEIIFLVSR